MTPSGTDWGWMAGVCREGFDPAGPNGPTYYRVARTDKDGHRYYSTFRRPDIGEPVLLITDLHGDDFRATPEKKSVKMNRKGRRAAAKDEAQTFHMPLIIGKHMGEMLGRDTAETLAKAAVERIFQQTRGEDDRSRFPDDQNPFLISLKNDAGIDMTLLVTIDMEHRAIQVGFESDFFQGSDRAYAEHYQRITG